MIFSIISSLAEIQPYARRDNLVLQEDGVMFAHDLSNFLTPFSRTGYASWILEVGHGIKLVATKPELASVFAKFLIQSEPAPRKSISKGKRQTKKR
jgi:hypothetical protein